MEQQKTQARLFRLLAGLFENKTATIAELARKHNVSDATIRLNLDMLVKIFPQIQRMYGHVMWHESGAWPESSFTLSLSKNSHEKLAIANCIADLIPNGAHISLGGGTTAYYVAEAIVKKKKFGIKIISESLPVAVTLGGYRHCKVVLMGGNLEPDYLLALWNNEKAFHDLLCESGLENDGTPSLAYAIMGAKGFDPEKLEILGDNPRELMWREKIVKHTRVLIIGFDHCKMDIESASYRWCLNEFLEKEYSRLFLVTDGTKDSLTMQIRKKLPAEFEAKIRLLIASQHGYTEMQ